MGAVWYQGESNSWDYPSYPCLQEAMVGAWRQLFQSEFFFIYTQLSTWQAGGYVLPSMRDAQTSILLSGTPGVGMVTAADLGDPDSPYGDIHPRNKMELGRRMALAASAIQYGSSIPYEGPVVEKIEPIVNPVFGSSLRVTFQSHSCGAGCKILPAQICPPSSSSVNGGCGYVLLKYGSWTESLASVVLHNSNTVDFIPNEFRSENVTSLSYGWGDYPLMVVYNSYNIPLIPFVSNF